MVDIKLRINSINKVFEEVCILPTSNESVVYVQLRSCVHWICPVQPRTEAYSKTNQTSKMENLVKIVHGYELVTFFCKKIRHKLLTGFWIGLCRSYLHVCVCVCLYSSTVKASSVCKMSKTYLRVRINDLVLWILVDCVMPSSIIAVSENVIFHLQRWKLQPFSYWRENDII